MRSGSITVLRTVRLNRGSNGSLHFWHRPVLEHKRTVMVSGSRFFRSDRTVRSGFQNIDYFNEWEDWIGIGEMRGGGGEEEEEEERCITIMPHLKQLTILYSPKLKSPLDFLRTAPL